MIAGGVAPGPAAEAEVALVAGPRRAGPRRRRCGGRAALAARAGQADAYWCDLGLAPSLLVVGGAPIALAVEDQDRCTSSRATVGAPRRARAGAARWPPAASRARSPRPARRGGPASPAPVARPVEVRVGDERLWRPARVLGTADES